MRIRLHQDRGSMATSNNNNKKKKRSPEFEIPQNIKTMNEVRTVLQKAERLGFI